MAVTRLKRKSSRNKNRSKRLTQFLKQGTNLEVGSRAKAPRNKQHIKNLEILASLEK
ncbi:MAG TPA: hypothetical protein VK076_10510 [Candidatus Sphingobacterium stercoripullorum]|nr:hypothetical protein [Candidatus Sphingobacterium stercoripullorum]